MGTKLNETYKGAAIEFARRVASALGDQVDSIVLYGSVARGEAKRDSDIDILVVSPEPEVARKQASVICEDFTFERNYTFFISLIHYSREELHRLIEVGSPFLANVINEGVMLYDNGTFSRVREKAFTTSGRSSG